jgi:hypothetical protein
VRCDVAPSWIIPAIFRQVLHQHIFAQPAVENGALPLESGGAPAGMSAEADRSGLPDKELVAQIKAVIAELPTYGYRRVHAILKRQALAGTGVEISRTPLSATVGLPRRRTPVTVGAYQQCR